MPRAVLDMMDRRPIWAMPEWVPEQIRAALPDEWQLVVIDEETDGSGDGAGRVSAAVLEAVASAEIYFGYGIAADLIEAGRALRWVHTGAAGVGKSLTPAMLSSDLVFTNSAAVHAEPIAETVIGMMLFFGRGLDFAVTNQRTSSWHADPYYRDEAPIVELSASTVGIVGYGGIGKEVARRPRCRMKFQVNRRGTALEIGQDLAVGDRWIGMLRHLPNIPSTAAQARDGRYLRATINV